MATAVDVRKFSLTLDGVSEADHFGRPSFRTSKRIFAVIRPDGLNLHVPQERMEFLFEAAPDVFVKQMWGKRVYMVVQLPKIGKRELEALIRDSHEASRPAARPKRPAKARPAAKARRR